ncbi:hypothetical protein DFH11DRAFT_1576289 [Phellopilus nigrolimitatus]|nr:hypothetical protein DFH11DRAFT_1576289 [Phellopilus nigrolimitatus]
MTGMTGDFNSPSRPRTVMRVRGASTSESDFPTPGTRAKQERDRRTLEEKTQPYTPAPGTRAAEVSRTWKGKQRARE